MKIYKHKRVWLLLAVYFLVLVNCQQTTQNKKCKNDIDEFKSMKTLMRQFKLRIVEDIQLNYIGIYKWNRRYQYFYNYIIHWITFYKEFSAYQIMMNYYLLSWTPIPNTTCTNSQVYDRRMFLVKSLAYFNTINPNVVFPNISHIRVFNSSTFTMVLNLNTTLMFNYLSNTIDTIDKAWKTCSSKVNQTLCNEIYVSSDILLGKFLYWFENDRRLTYLYNDDRMILTRFIHLITVGKIDWNLGNYYMSKYPLEIQKNVTFIKSDAINRIQNLIETYNSSVKQIPSIIKNVDLFIGSSIDNKIIRLINGYLSGKFKSSKMDAICFYGISIIGLVGNFIVILMYRENLKSTHSYNKTLIAILSILDSTCLLFQLVIGVLSRFNIISTCNTSYIYTVLTLMANWTLAYLCSLRAVTLLFPFFTKTYMTFKKSMQIYIGVMILPTLLYIISAILIYIFATVNHIHCTAKIKNNPFLKNYTGRVLPILDIIIPTNIPITVIFISNFIVGNVLIKRKASNLTTQTNNKMSKQDKQIITMLALSGTVFLILNMPYEVLLIVYRIKGNEQHLGNNLFFRLDRDDFLSLQMVMYLFYDLSTALLMPLNYGINFYFYLLSRGFREELNQLFKRSYKN